MKWLIACTTLALGACVTPLAAAAAQPSSALSELVAPIALYPDVLLAQMLAASTHPADLAHAKLWLADYRATSGGTSVADLAQAVDGEPWDPAIKALTLTPVLDAMNRNAAWTTALGEAYADDPARVLDAVQIARHKAQAAGELARTREQNVIANGATILIEPTDSAFVHVPGGDGLVNVGVFERFSWGWHGWQLNWKDKAVMYGDLPLTNEVASVTRRAAR